MVETALAHCFSTSTVAALAASSYLPFETEQSCRRPALAGHSQQLNPSQVRDLQIARATLSRISLISLLPYYVLSGTAACLLVHLMNSCTDSQLSCPVSAYTGLDGSCVHPTVG